MRQELLARTFWRGILGIIFEIMLVALFVVAGLFICLLWWKVIK